MKTRTLNRLLPGSALTMVSLVLLLGCASNRYERSETRYSGPGFAGRITEIDRGDYEITVRSPDAARTFKLAENADIIDHDGQQVDIGDLRVGDRVVVYSSRRRGAHVAHRIESEHLGYGRAYGTEEMRAENQCSGTISGIDRGDGVLKLNVHNPSKENAVVVADREFELARDARISTDEDPDATLNDLHVGDHVTIAYHEENGDLVADRVGPPGMVLTRSGEWVRYGSAYEPRGRPHTFSGTVVAIDSDAGTLTVKGLSSDHTFRFTDGAEIVLSDGDTSRSLRSLRVGDEVTISYTEGRYGPLAQVVVLKDARGSVEP